MSGTAAQRVNWIDAVKGLTMTLVVVKHVTYGTDVALHSMPHYFDLLCQFASPFRMPLFFLVAGLFAQRALRGDLKNFLDGKLIHFVYFYVLWSVIQIGLKAVLPSNSIWNVHLSDLLLIPVEPFGLLWFLYALAIFFCVMRLCRDVPRVLMVGLALVLFFSNIHTGWTIPDEFAHRFIFFISGVYGAPAIFRLADWARANAKLAIPMSLALFVLVGAIEFSGLVSHLGLELLASFTGAAATIMTLSVLAGLGHAKVLTYIGSNSLYVFLAFFLPMAVVRTVLIKLGFTDGDLIVLMTSIAAVGLPLAAYRILKDTRLSFFFVRPEMFKLTGKRAPERLAAV